MHANFVGNCVKSVRHNGLLSTITLYWNRLCERAYERHLGIQSGEIISLQELGLSHEERRQHYPTQFSDFQLMVSFLRPETPNEVFIDYGAGLGRAVVLAAMLPFKRVIGIEISPVLVDRARENVSRCRGKLRCGEVEIVNADAASFEVPTDATTIFFNNPFAGTILVNVLHKIGKSYEQQPRRIKIVCNLPLQCAFCEEISRAEGLELQRKFRLGKERQCLIFSVRRGLNDLSVGN